jgi:hypothetical protein
VSIILTIGRYGGFYTSLDGPHKRICLGWLAIELWFCEVEDVHAKMFMLWPDALWAVITGEAPGRVVWQRDGDDKHWRVWCEEARQ